MQHDRLKLPGGDLLIHAGDATCSGSRRELGEFITWFATLPYAHKIWTPGNHCRSLERHMDDYRVMCEDRGITLLHDSGIEIDGVKIWGSGVSLTFGKNWAFNRDRGPEITKHWDLIPKDTEILITHSPPAAILDLVPDGTHAGCYDLYRAICQLPSLKLNVFGHLHRQGQQTALLNPNFHGDQVILFVNAAVLDDCYSFRNCNPVKVTRSIKGLYKVPKTR
jgi:calcineurin-like phosphoesterase family protein